MIKLTDIPSILVGLRLTIAQICLEAIGWLKFSELPSFHTYTVKTWGLTLLIATVRLFGFDDANFIWLAIGISTS